MMVFLWDMAKKNSGEDGSIIGQQLEMNNLGW